MISEAVKIFSLEITIWSAPRMKEAMENPVYVINSHAHFMMNYNASVFCIESRMLLFVIMIFTG